MTEQDFIHMFGSPKSRTTKGLWKYDWTTEAKYTEDEKRAAAAAGHPVPADTYLIGVTIEARFAKGALEYFYISKGETT